MEEYYYIQAGISRNAVHHKTLLAATRAGNKLFGYYRLPTLRIKHHVPGVKAKTVKTLHLN